MKEEGKTYIATRPAKRMTFVRFRAKKPLVLVDNGMVSRDANRS